MTDTLIVCSILPGRARLNAVKDLAAALRRWRRTDDHFLPVSAFACDQRVWCRVTGTLPLPREVTLERAVELFGRLRRDDMPAETIPPMIAQVHYLGDRAAPLLRDWYRALTAAVQEIA